MRQSRPLLPIRPLALPARLGRRRHTVLANAAAVPANAHLAVGATVHADVRVRFQQSNLAVARASRPVWLRGPLFHSTSSQRSPAFTRRAA